MRKQFKQWILLAFFTPTLAIAQSSPDHAITTSTFSSASPIEAAKQTAIKDLLDAIDALKLVNAISSSAQMQAKQLVPAILSDVLTENKVLKDKQKQAIVSSLQKNTVPKLVESAGTIFNSEQFRQDAMRAQYEAYAKYYSVFEIKDLTAFYKSPTGRRFIDVQDHVGHDVISSLMQKYMPESIKATRNQADKEMTLLKVK
ncbi:DUF2059 domain-containing protein [Candidatus Vallotia cooleyia]|uniref:DUF2059 domain-containing protein n=1 Tax=Candidatus Vallotiella adelgis TaxID=1177211 RepID=UPI001D02DEF1|nr:DUF2059 domain-containing protein [Candidatus Vallotia cooleyia]UDG82079.1 hypothetical protein GJV44_00315 [Candidatus Vallotia cooleyia]